MKIKPLYDKVVVERSQKETKTSGGIILPETAREKPLEGKVLAVGHGKLKEDGSLQPLGIKVGDRVLLSSYAGTEVEVDGQTYVIVKEEEILGIVDSSASVRVAGR